MIGTQEISTYYLGSSPVSKLYKGAALVWEAGGSDTQDLIFLSPDLTNTAQVYTKSSGGHAAYSPTISLASGQSARLVAQINNSQNNFYLGFDVNANTPYAQMDFCIQVGYFPFSNPPETAIYSLENSGANPHVGNYPLSTGYVAVNRNGNTGVVTIEISDNKIDWVVQHTFAGISLGALQINLSLDNEGYLSHPQLIPY